MKRLRDWRSRLSVTVHRANLPFQWGTNDCATFAADCIQAVIGVDLAADWRATYSDMLGAIIVIKRAGFVDLPGLVLALLGAESEIPPSAARRGDVALIPTDSELGWAIGVFDHERVLVMTDVGYGTEDRGKVTRAFKVGE